jgi:hypothetical protein
VLTMRKGVGVSGQLAHDRMRVGRSQHAVLELGQGQAANRRRTSCNQPTAADM